MKLSATFSALTATAILVAGCGSDGSPTPSAANPASAVKTGGALTTYSTSYPDSIDPALAYTGESWTDLWPVYTSLLTYEHAEGLAGAELVPGLAEALPTVSTDGLTYSLTLRKGLKYSDGSPVKAADFEHSIKRVLRLESGGAFYYEGIKGAIDYEKSKDDDADISGITSDEATGEITIELSEPDGQFPYYLAMLFSAPVPSSTPFEPMSTKAAVGVGPFAITAIRPNRGFTLARNANFPVLPTVPAAKADSIKLSVVQNQRRQAQDVIADKVDLIPDAPVADQLGELKSQAGDRFKEYVTNNTYFFFLNTRVAPFDNEKVRLAVGTAMDERALARLFGGLLEPDCNFLPPDMLGYEKLAPCPFGDPTAAPDLAKAKALITEAGATGAKVKVYSTESETSVTSTAYLADVMNSIGLDATTQTVADATYFQTVGNATTKAQAGFSAFFQDYPGPANFFQIVDGRAIQPTNNQNPGNVDDALINEELTKAKNLDPKAAAPTYEAIDKQLVDKAYVLPYGHKKQVKLTSSRVAFDAAIYHPVFGIDLASVGLAATK